MGLQSAFIGLTLLMNLIIWFIGSTAINKTFENPSKRKKKKTQLILGLALWQVYTFATASSGILDDYGFPPRFALLLIIPLFVFTGIFIYKNRSHQWINSIPKHWLVFYQSFRILIETIFVFSVAQGILNKEVTIEGYNYDMVFAYTAPIIGFLVFRKLIPRKLTIVWNYLGLAVIASIIFLFMSSLYNPQLFGSETMLLPPQAVKYPYVLVAGFLMPSAVFMHLLSIIQLTGKTG